MAVPEQIPVVNYVADGIVKKFDVPFEYDQQSDLHVYVDGVEPTIDKYFFADNSFNFYIAPTVGQDVKIKRITPKERDTDYNLHTNTVRPKALNTDFDRLWYVLQEVFSDVGGLSQTVQDEIIARIQGDEDLLNQLTAEISARMLGDEAVTEDLKNYVDQVIGAIINDPDFDGIDADKVNDASGETQQQVNYNGGSKWHSRVGGYKLNERVILTNSDIVKSTIDGNTSDPNVDMTGWVKTNSASQIVDESGDNQQKINNDTGFFIRSNDTDINIFKACTPAKIASIKSGALTDITEELRTLINDDTGRTVRLIKGNYAVEDTLNITKRNLKIVGDVGDRYNANGTMLHSNLDGILFKLGTEVPLANWNDDLYNGIQGFTLKNLNISQRVRNTNLLGQTLEKYGSNSFAIQDWCGGHLDIENVWFEGFYRAVFGLQSDFSSFKKIRSSYNKQAIVMANRSDQITINDFYSFYNDNALTTASTYLNLSNHYSVNDGSASTVPIEVLCGASSIVIDHPWFETLAGEASTREAYIRAGVNAGFTGITSVVDGLSVINNPLVYTKPQGETNTTKSLIDVGKVISLEVDESSTKSGQSSNLAQLVNVVGDSSITASTTRGTINIKRNSNIASLFKNSSSGTPSISVCGDLSGSHLIATPSGRQLLRKIGGNATSDLFISGEDSDGGVYINAPNTTSGQKNRLVIRKSYQQLAAIPTTGTWNIGDYVQNQNPVILGTVGSKYTVQGWSRITNGSSHVLNTDWVECRALTGT